MWTAYVVDSVDTTNGMIFLKGEGCFKPHRNPNNLVPEPGETIEVKTYQGRDAVVGMRILGVRIRGETLFEISAEEVERQDTDRRRKLVEELKAVFAASRYAERLAALPVWMQERQAALEMSSSDYTWRYGRLDLAVLETANLLLNKYKTPEELKAFSEMTTEEVIETFPTIDRELTDRMMSSAVLTALAYMGGVVYPHSTMCQILDCEVMNCVANRAKTLQAPETSATTG